MPVIKAAVKHLRQSEKQRVVNRARKTRLKDQMKTMLKLAAQKKPEEFAKNLPAMMSLIDKSAKNHIIHPNNAARKKSRLAHLLAALK